MRKLTRKKMRGGDFGALLIASFAIPFFASYSPIFQKAFSYLGKVHSDRDVLVTGSVLLVASLNLMYNMYNQGGVKWMITTPLMSGASEILKADYLIQDLKEIYSQFLRTGIDLVFLYDKHVIRVPPAIVQRETALSTNMSSIQDSVFHDNSIISLLLDLWIIALRDMVASHNVPTPSDGNTSMAVENRAPATWRKVCNLYRERFARIENEGPYARVYDYLNLVLFTEKMPEFIQIMLEHTNLYQSRLDIPGAPYNYAGILRSLEDIRTLLIGNTTLRIDNSHKFFRRMVLDPRFVDFDIVTPSSSFQSFLWNLLQQLLSSGTKFKEFSDLAEECNINMTDLICLGKKLNSLYGSLYITRCTVLNRVTLPVVAATVAASSSVTTRLRGLYDRVVGRRSGGHAEEAKEEAKEEATTKIAIAGEVTDIVGFLFEALLVIVNNNPTNIQKIKKASIKAADELSHLVEGEPVVDGEDTFYDANGGKRTRKKRSV